MITGKNFSEGDQVLQYDSKLHLFSGKLKSRWTGPFIVQQAYPNGSVDLLDPNDDRVIKVNGQRVNVTPRNLYRYKLRKIIMIGICIGISYGK